MQLEDVLQGPQRQNLRKRAGDFVVRRVEGLYACQLACAVDDAFRNVTEVVRGYDLLESTPRQIWLQQLLGMPTPSYLHLPVATDSQERKMSKSERARPVVPADPMPGLRRALAFLGVPVARESAGPAVALAAAMAYFDPAALPHCPSRPVV